MDNCVDLSTKNSSFSKDASQNFTLSEDLLIENSLLSNFDSDVNAVNPSAAQREENLSVETQSNNSVNLGMIFLILYFNNVDNFFGELKNIF